MTRTIALFLLIFVGITTQAQWTPTANLTIFSEDGDKFYLILNGEKYNEEPETNIRVEELPNPYYNCKIIFADAALPEISKSMLMLTDADGIMQDVTYRIRKDKKGKNVLKFFSQIPAEQNMVRPSNVVTYRYGAPKSVVGVNVPGASVNVGVGQGTTTTTTTVQQTNVNPGVNINLGNMGVNVNMNVPGMTGSVTTTTTTTTTSSSSGGDLNFDEDYGDEPAQGRGGCRVAMRTDDFNSARNTIKGSNFDDTRLSTAKQIVSSNCVSASQILQIMEIFSFEATKLDFAKYAYDYCMDKNNYFKVNNGFTYSSSKDELNAYIQGR